MLSSRVPNLQNVKITTQFGTGIIYSLLNLSVLGHILSQYCILNLILKT